MLKLKFPTLLSRLNIRIGTKLAVTVGIGVVLVAGMMLNQQLSNASLAQQAELERNEQFVTADMLRGGVALQRMQIGTREIRLSISEREADEALAALRENMGNAVSYLLSAAQLCGDTDNCARFEKLVKLAEAYAAAAAEMTALKKDYAEITKPLEQVSKIGTEIEVLIAKATADAKTLASQRMAIAAARRADAAQINIAFGLFVVVILTGAAIFGVLSIGRPIKHIAGVLLQLANGTREFDIPYADRGDEVGDAARAARAFRDNLVRLERLETEQKQTAARAVAERKDMVRNLAATFEQAIGNIVGAVSSAAIKLESTAGILTKNAEATQQLSAAAAVASAQASTNVQ
jgi:methyl-accepting chemotaxis protein